MSKVERWKGIFGKSKAPKKTVRVGNSFEEFTHTQAYRFNQLTKSNGGQRSRGDGNPFDQAKYSLGDAAFRLMTSEADVVRRAASGEAHLFVPAAGIKGRWRYLSPDDKATESSDLMLNSGHLALTIGTCRQLATSECAEVSVLLFPTSADAATLEFDAETAAVLSTSGKRKIAFLMAKPRRISRDELVLMAPLLRHSL